MEDRHAPLYEIKADLFKGLAHPLRIRLLEILVASPSGTCTVSEMLTQMDVKPSNLSAHLFVLRHHRVVTSTRIGNSVEYSLTCPEVEQLLSIARSFLQRTLTDAESLRHEVAHLPEIQPARVGAGQLP